MLSASLTSNPLPDLGSEGALTSLPELTVPGCNRAGRSSLESILYENQTVGQEILRRHKSVVPRLDSQCIPHGDAAQLLLHTTGCCSLCLYGDLSAWGRGFFQGFNQISDLHYAVDEDITVEEKGK